MLSLLLLLLILASPYILTGIVLCVSAAQYIDSRESDRDSPTRPESPDPTAKH